jgi:hypothetical protein
MSLLFSEVPDANREVQRLAEVLEAVFLLQMMLVDDLPSAAELLPQHVEGHTLQGEHTTPARHALL